MSEGTTKAGRRVWLLDGGDHYLIPLANDRHVTVWARRIPQGATTQEAVRLLRQTADDIERAGNDQDSSAR